jgi:hypothetical protein
MANITIDRFAGLMPEIESRNLPQTAAQIAHNCLLWDGSLRPMPKWKYFRKLATGTLFSRMYIDPRTNALYNAYDYGEGVILTGSPFATNVLVGVNLQPDPDIGYLSNIYQTKNYNDSLSAVSIPAGLPTPNFGDSDDGGVVNAYISASVVSYISQIRSKKPVNRIIGITFCRSYANGIQEGPIAVLPGQSPYAVMFEGDILHIELELNLPRFQAEDITHIRLYRTISGLDSGEQVANELDTDWHLITTLKIKGNIVYNDGGAATTDPLDLYLAGHFYRPQFPAAYFGLSESGWFYMANYSGEIAFSERYLHAAWPTENRMSLRTEVRDIVCKYDNLYVGTINYPYIISLGPGEGEQGLQTSATPFTAKLPCLAGSMCVTPSGAMYASNIGLVSLTKDGPTVITKGILRPGAVLYTEET